MSYDIPLLNFATPKPCTRFFMKIYILPPIQIKIKSTILKICLHKYSPNAVQQDLIDLWVSLTFKGHKIVSRQIVVHVKSIIICHMRIGNRPN